ncbi:MAG: DUF373 family protein [Candidatus Diapherotrites archaeon]|nr:DUF373 family protein [Candidatus Diapherotrites archaeon]
MKKKTIVLCVDRDDDYGKKAGVKSPIKGEKANLAAAQALALKDPSESDINAVYGAVKAYRQLKKDGDAAEVVTICGHRDRDHKADKAIVKQVENILKKGDVKGIVLVSDGADDEQVLPLIQSRVKVLGVRTIIVKQAKELEKSYYVIKEVLRDPHFARLVFGLPGIALALYGAVHLLGIQQISLNVFLALIGVYLILKGFGIEDALVGAFNTFRKTTSIERASFPLYIGSMLLSLLSLWAGFDNISFVWDSVPAGVIIKPGYINIVNIAGFLLGFIGLAVLAAILFLAGRIGDMYYKREYYRIRKYARSIVSMIALFVIADVVGRFLLFWTDAVATGPTFADLFVAVGTSFMITLVGFLVIKYIYITKYVKPRVRKGIAIKDTDGEDIGKISYIDYKSNYFYYTKGGEKTPVSFNKVLLVRDNSAVIA